MLNIDYNDDNSSFTGNKVPLQLLLRATVVIMK